MKPNWNDLIDWGSSSYLFTMKEKDFFEVKRSEEKLKKILLEKKQSIYGLHTGYGANVTEQVVADDWKNHQLHLLNYLAVGAGEFFEESIVRRALRIQAYKMSLGYSGISLSTFTRLVQLSNQPDLPKVPSLGSLGASGDLIPMAHAVAPIFIDYEPQGPRDVIALVNTNSMMASYALQLAEETASLLNAAHKVTGLVGWSLGVTQEAQSPWSLSLQEEQDWAHKSAVEIASKTNEVLTAHRFQLANKNHRNIPLQEKYSIRCAPQILGNAKENLSFASSKIYREAISLADNPVVPKQDNQSIAHGGLFYTSLLASAADLLNDVVFRIGELLDRQILILMDPSLSHGLPTNLQINQFDHCKGIHQLVSSLVQVLRSKSMPSRNLSFSCESNNQDVVPCSMNALHLLRENLRVCEKIVEASEFISHRACYLAAGLTVPSNYTLEQFKKNSSSGMNPQEPLTKKKGDTYEFR